MRSEEQLLPLAKAVEQATGQRPHPSTLHRWRLRGISGVKLETVRCGGRRLCSADSVRKFLSDVTAVIDGHPPQARTSKQSERDMDRAAAELARDDI